MHIEHIAIWTNRLEELRQFYITYFNAVSNEGYHNPVKKFRSYFLSFGNGARLELMQRDGIPDNLNNVADQYIGLIHFAMSVGSREAVDTLTKSLHDAGFQVLDGPRQTGDGYYESVVLDPEGNRIEITC
ncbi:VOC family protein [Flavihumibacter fluvii]|uniref:VOC family protein n=1 Tax=Flavihumibacter fluvii TaxID=2838157 RepID=UPI001BDF46B6|nr:VOC family protein [Flavihumibacter fluvii]ULQ51346.1 VOC family protein [Flavihumibacter fluvii]